MICPTCNAPNRDDAKFCKTCGQPLHLQPTPASEAVASDHITQCAYFNTRRECIFQRATND